MPRSNQSGPPGVPGGPETSAGPAISSELESLMNDYLGRGPTRARTYCSDDMIICVLEDELTKAERNLAALGREDEVREIRHLFHGALRDQAIAAVERVTGRRVISFMSDHDVGRDLGAQIFVLEPGAGAQGTLGGNVGAVGGSLDRATE
jgi:uncharacterized protein YbcI